MPVGLVVSPPLVVAQQSVPATLSLADAVAIAREHNPNYRQTLNNRGPSAWAVRNAFSSLLLPTVTASGGIGYSGPGQQRIFSANFSKNVASLSSHHSLGLNWRLSGPTVSQPGLKR